MERTREQIGVSLFWTGGCRIIAEVTCDQASFLFFFFFSRGKERLIQLLENSSAPPPPPLIKIKYLSPRLSAMSLVEDEPITITISRIVGDNYNGLDTATVVFDVALAVRPL